jgi:protein-S-isoprenylcysteine O-methyltransferase Ste14
MNYPILILALGTLAVIGALPRLFFRPGRLNLNWWLTAGPFLLSAITIVAAMLGVLSLATSESALRETLAGSLLAMSLFLMGMTLGTHRVPLSLWHQPNDAPQELVTSGAYSRIRHPFYAAFLLALAGCALAVPHVGTLGSLAYACIRLNHTAAAEERKLLGSGFSSLYADYMRRSGRFLPRLSA